MEVYKHQVGGHSQLMKPQDSSKVFKPYSDTEYRFYEKLWGLGSTSTDSGPLHVLKQFVPKYFGITEVQVQTTVVMTKTPSTSHAVSRPSVCPLHPNDPPCGGSCSAATAMQVMTSTASGSPQTGRTTSGATCSCSASSASTQRPATLTSTNKQTVKYIVLEDLVYLYKKPCVIDLKMGTRQRKIGASPDKERRQLEKSLKTTSHALGFRLCGYQFYDKKHDTLCYRDKYWGRKLTADKILQSIGQWFWNGYIMYHDLITPLINSLKLLYSCIAELRQYRFWSSSLLWVYDGGLADTKARIQSLDVKMIDFANTIVLKDQPLHDEEYLFGLSNVITILETLAQSTAIAASLAWGSSSSSVDSGTSQFRWATGPNTREIPLLDASAKTSAKEYHRGLRSISRTRRKTRLDLEEYSRTPLQKFAHCPQRERNHHAQPSAPHAKPLRSLQHLQNDTIFLGGATSFQGTYYHGLFSKSTGVKFSPNVFSQRQSIARVLSKKKTDPPKPVPLPLHRRAAVQASVLQPFRKQQLGTDTFYRSLSDSEVYFSPSNALDRVTMRSPVPFVDEDAETGASSSRHSCLADGEEDEEDDENNNNYNATTDSEDPSSRRSPSARNSRSRLAVQLSRVPRTFDRTSSSARRRPSTLSSIVTFGIRAPRLNRFQEYDQSVDLPRREQPLFFPHGQHRTVATNFRHSDASSCTLLGSTSFTLESGESRNYLSFSKRLSVASGSPTGARMNGLLRATTQGSFSEPPSTEVAAGRSPPTTAIPVIDHPHCASTTSLPSVSGNKELLLSPFNSQANETARVQTTRNLAAQPTALATLPSFYGLLRRTSLRRARNTVSLQHRFLHCVTPTFWSGLLIQGTHGRSLHFAAPTLSSSLSIYGTNSRMLEKNRRRYLCGYTRYKRILQPPATPVDIYTSPNISSDSPVPSRVNAVDFKPPTSIEKPSDPDDVLPVSQRGSKALGAFTLPHTISGIQACVSDSEEATSCTTDHSSNDAPNQGDVDDEAHEQPLFLVTRGRKPQPLRKQRIFSRSHGRYMHFMLPDDRKSWDYPCGHTKGIQNRDVSHLPRPRSSSCRSIVTFASRESPLTSSTDLGHHHHAL